jgi:hypothetical protein
MPPDARSLLIFLIGLATGLGIALVLPVLHAMPLPTVATSAVIETPKAAPATTHPQKIVSEKPSASLSPKDDLLLKLFLPSESDLASQQEWEQVSARIEQTLSLSYVLLNCEMLPKRQYPTLYQKLYRYLSMQKRTNPEHDMREIASRANANYRFIYRHIPCDDASLLETQAALSDWLALSDLTPQP